MTLILLFGKGTLTLTHHRFFWGRILDYRTDLHAPYPEVLERLRSLVLKTTPQHVSLQGLPGTGKSSAIQELASVSRLVYLDMNRLYRETTDGFHTIIASELARRLGYTPVAATPWRQIVESLNNTERSGPPILVVLDHFDRFIQFGDSDIRRGILAQFLGLMNNYRHVGFVYVSVRPLVHICEDIDHMSELPERCTNLSVKGLSAESSKQLLEQGLAEAEVIAENPRVIMDLVQGAGGNPSLVQICGAALATDGAQSAAQVMSTVINDARVLFDRIFEMFPINDWKALLRYKTQPQDAGGTELQIAEKMRDALIYYPVEQSFFSGVFETYLNQRLVPNEQAKQSVFVRRPAALIKQEHEIFLRAACSDAAVHEVDWSLVGAGPEPRYVYNVRPSSASGNTLRPFFLKIDNRSAIDKEARCIERVRSLGVITPPVEIVEPPGGGSFKGLKTDVASVDPRSSIWTLKEYVGQPAGVPSDLGQTLSSTYHALAGLYQTATRKERTLRGVYQLQDNLATTLETAFASLSDPFGSAFIRHVMLPPAEALARFQDFLKSKESLLCAPIHGDLHGRNVIRDERGNVQVIDFGRFQSDGHVLADCSRLELSLLFDYAQATGHNSSDALTLLQILINRTTTKTIFNSGLKTGEHPLESVLGASRKTVVAVFPDIEPREYMVSLLGTVLVLLSFKDYFTSTYRWVAVAFAHQLLNELAAGR